MVRSGVFVASARPLPVGLVSLYVHLSLIRNIPLILQLPVDVIPPGPPVLRQVRLDIHIPAWYQTPCSIVYAMH